MPKKPQRNAFYFFMKELEPQLRREGRVFPNGMADVVPLAHPRWKDLPAKEKERFENMAKEFKAKMRGVEGDKYRMDTKGNIIAYRKNETDEMNNYFIRMAKDIKASWPPGQEVIDESFFLVNFQTLCETEEGVFLPCELACLQLSLNRGVIKTFHKFIHPGRIPTGYKYTCMKNSELTHQIPCEFEEADADYSWIWTQLKNFINPNNEKDVYPPVYCRPSVYRETRRCLEWLHSMAMDRGTCKLGRVLNLEGLVMDLYEHMGKSKGIYQAVDILSTTSYDFVPNHRCKFHEDLECKHCSLGILNRYAYSMFSELAVVYEFELTPRHLPERAEHDMAVTVIPPPKHSIFPQPAVNRGQPSYSELARGGQSRSYQKGDGDFASRDFRYPQLSQTSDSEDLDRQENEPPALRLPKRSGMSVGSASSSVQRSRPPVSMGRGITMTMENSGPASNSFAAAPGFNGREGSVLRPGPSAGLPVGRGMHPSAMSAASVSIPPGVSRHSLPQSRPKDALLTMSSMGCGRGVLGPLAQQNTEIRVPFGRGYAPPSMAERVGDGIGRMSLSNQ